MPNKRWHLHRAARKAREKRKTRAAMARITAKHIDFMRTIEEAAHA